MTHRQKIGLVGVGYLGRVHARVLTEMPQADVIGFVDSSDDNADEVKHKLGLRRFETVGALAAEIDCAVIATPTSTHAAIATELIAAGCDVMIEKPVTTTPDEARALQQQAAAADRIIQVGHVERYNPAIVAMVEHISEPRFIQAERLGVFVPRSLDVDVLLDLMIHDLNLVLSLFDREVTDVQAVGVPVLTDKVDIANVRLELDNGAVANLTASRVSSERVRKFRVFGSDSYLSADTREQDVKGFRLIDREGGREIESLDVRFERKEPIRSELESFLGCVATRSRPVVDISDGIAALELAHRVGAEIERSMAKWRR